MMQAAAPPLILASQSTARAALLTAAGLRFDTMPARIDESAVKDAARAEGASADDTALLLSVMKARRIRSPGALVIGADQLLVAGDAWFDKPADRPGAAAHLRALRGREHILVTAVVCLRDGQEVWRHVARPRLRMRTFGDAWLEAYLDREGDAILASVGAYRLEGAGIHLFDEIEGEHAAILGLPLLPLLGFLRQHGVLAA
ncbi:MAG: Maf family protein [Gemmatimonadaceae bacterium]|nr:Maf family protein [Acetobacteraceae bacterium]